MWFPTRSDTNQAVQSQKQSRSFAVFANADCWFSHAAAQLYLLKLISNNYSVKSSLTEKKKKKKKKKMIATIQTWQIATIIVVLNVHNQVLLLVAFT